MFAQQAVSDWIKAQNPKFAILKRFFGNASFELLDIGAGNRSASKTKALFPNCRYSGVDLTRDYNNDPEDFLQMDHFFELDLTRLQFEVIPDHHYDAILMTHVLEHLPNGDAVLIELTKKLKPGGIFYIEFPGPQSTRLPSMKGTLNFYDDHTHVRLYQHRQVGEWLQMASCQILSSGTRRSVFYIAVTPLRIPFRWIRGKPVTGNIFWDLLGFAEYVLARKR